MALISVEKARQLSNSALLKTGMNADEVTIITDVLIEAELMGRPTHGLIT